MVKQNEIQSNEVDTLNSYNLAQAFNVYLSDDQYFYNLLKNISFPEDISSGLFRLVRPRPNELLPQLAFRTYRISDLWWLIAKVNNINNPLEPLDPEVELKILTNAGVTFVLNSIIND